MGVRTNRCMHRRRARVGNNWRRVRHARPGRHRATHRRSRGVAQGRNLVAGASVMVAVGLLATGGDAEMSHVTGSDAAATTMAPPGNIADRAADRAARRVRPDDRRTGTIPPPNAATRAKPSPTPKPTPKPAWVVPTHNYRLTSGYGQRWGALHAGVDLAAPSGTPIRSVRAGMVERAGWYGGYGYAVIVDHGGGVSTLYGHNSRLLVTEGERIGTGQRIALMGSTGHSTGPHLHLEIHLDDEPVDPVPWLRERGVRL